jgi:hypothetical protein
MRDDAGNIVPEFAAQMLLSGCGNGYSSLKTQLDVYA